MQRFSISWLTASSPPPPSFASPLGNRGALRQNKPKSRTFVHLKFDGSCQEPFFLVMDIFLYHGGRFVLIILLVLHASLKVLASEFIPLVYPHNCTEYQFFDKSHLRCLPCDDVISTEEEGRSLVTQQLWNASIQYNYLRRSEDGFSCRCAALAYQLVTPDSVYNKLECKACPNGQVTSMDGFSCAICEPPSSFNNESGTCQCHNGIQREKKEGDIIKQVCQTCQRLTKPNQDRTSCLPCHQSFRHQSQQNCSCPSSKYKVSGGVCLPNFAVISEGQSLYHLKYETKESVRSAFFVHNLQAASYNCKNTENRTACQILGNLCVLLHYSFYDNDFSKDTTACTEYRKLMSSGDNFNREGRIWPKKAPWLYYRSDTKSELKRPNVPNHFSIGDALNLIAFRYSASGNLIEASRMRPLELQLCKGNSMSAESGFFFGTNFDKYCTLSASELWSAAADKATDLIFYDLFIESENGDQIYPVAVRLTNLKRNGELVNDYDNKESWQLVRRFYLLEALTGIEAKLPSSRQDQEVKVNASKVLRYARNIEISIKLNKDKDDIGAIFPPLLKITYGELSRDDIAKGTEVGIRFKVIYEMNQAGPDRDVSISLAVLCCCAVLWSFFRSWRWAKRAGKQAIDVTMVGEFLVIAGGTLGNVFFLVIVGTALHYFVSYKRQVDAVVLLPTSHQEYYIYVYIITAFLLKLIYVIHELAICCCVNIFFIDWERPKAKGQSLMGNDRKPTSAGGALSGGKNTDVEKAEDTARNRRSSLAHLARTEKIMASDAPAVSIWRTYFVANEWVELCSCRRLNIGTHALLVILFLNVSF